MTYMRYGEEESAASALHKGFKMNSILFILQYFYPKYAFFSAKYIHVENFSFSTNKTFSQYNSFFETQGYF